MANCKKPDRSRKERATRNGHANELERGQSPSAPRSRSGSSKKSRSRSASRSGKTPASSSKSQSRNTSRTGRTSPASRAHARARLLRFEQYKKDCKHVSRGQDRETICTVFLAVVIFLQLLLAAYCSTVLYAAHTFEDLSAWTQIFCIMVAVEYVFLGATLMTVICPSGLFMCTLIVTEILLCGFGGWSIVTLWKNRTFCLEMETMGIFNCISAHHPLSFFTDPDTRQEHILSFAFVAEFVHVVQFVISLIAFLCYLDSMSYIRNTKEGRELLARIRRYEARALEKKKRREEKRNQEMHATCSSKSSKRVARETAPTEQVETSTYDPWTAAAIARGGTVRSTTSQSSVSEVSRVCEGMIVASKGAVVKTETTYEIPLNAKEKCAYGNPPACQAPSPCSSSQAPPPVQTRVSGGTCNTRQEQGKKVHFQSPVNYNVAPGGADTARRTNLSTMTPIVKMTPRIPPLQYLEEMSRSERTPGAKNSQYLF